MKVSHEEAAQMLKSKASRSELKHSLHKLSTGVDQKVRRRLEDFEEANAGPAFGTAESLSKSSSRGSFKLCLGCNRRVDKEDQLNKTNRAANPHDASRRYASPGPSTDGAARIAVSPNGRDVPQITHMGPGGAALGGGFQVRSAGSSRHVGYHQVPQATSQHHQHQHQHQQQQQQHSRPSQNQHAQSAVQLSIGNTSNANKGSPGARQQQFHSLPPEYSLPQIDPRLTKPATFVMGTDGRVYPGQRKQQLHTFNMGRSNSVSNVGSPGAGGGGGGGVQAKMGRRTPSRVNIGGGPETNGGSSPFMTQVSS
jgi:hypothetical protein